MSAGRPGVLLIGDTLNLGGTEGQFVEVACGLDPSRWSVHVSCLRAVGPLRMRLEAAGIRTRSCGRGSFKSTTRSMPRSFAASITIGSTPSLRMRSMLSCIGSAIAGKPW